MIKILSIFYLLSLPLYSNNFIERYNNYERLKLEIELEEKERDIKLLKKDVEIQNSYLEILYKDAEYRDYTENLKLEREIERAKIFYYNNKNQRKYYYYNRDYRPVFVN